MARPAEGYRTADGERVPGVTTVIHRFKDAGGLIHWAWQQGKDGKDYRETRDKAASAGTLAHAMVDGKIHVRPYIWPADTAPDVLERALKAYSAFEEWARQTKLIVTESEVSLVSEAYRYGGTFDALLIGDKRAMGDWKSSDGLYPEMLVQVAAYGKLWEEHHPDEPITGGYHILRFDKTYGDFHAHWWGELDAAWTAFLHLRALYDLERELKQRAR